MKNKIPTIEEFIKEIKVDSFHLKITKEIASKPLKNKFEFNKAIGRSWITKN